MIGFLIGISVIVFALFAVFFGLIYLLEDEYKQDNNKSCNELRDVILGNSTDGTISNYAKIQSLYMLKCEEK